MPKVVSVETIHLGDEVDVFDVEVETDASFIVGNSVLHNSGICRDRSNRLWSLEGAPIGHTLPFSRPPIHYLCRSHLIAVMHPFSDLPPRLQRRVSRLYFDGLPSPQPTLREWLARRPEMQDSGALDYQAARLKLGL